VCVAKFKKTKLLKIKFSFLFEEKKREEEERKMISFTED